MSGPAFFATRMGQQFYEHTVPSLVRAVERLAAAADNGAPASGAEYRLEFHVLGAVEPPPGDGWRIAAIGPATGGGVVMWTRPRGAPR